MFPSSLFAALAANSTVVTPNKRLARTIAAHYDDAQRRAGHHAWTAPRVMPWSAWLDELWRDVVQFDAMPSIERVLRAPAARWRWRQIITADGAPLSDMNGAAALAAEAWALAKAWGTGTESWRAWRKDGSEHDDSASFARWAERFHGTLSELRAVDDASLADILVTAAESVPIWRNVDVVFAGFLESTPQQQRLIRALDAKGARIARAETIDRDRADATQVSAPSPHDELALALSWARERALAKPGAIIGVAIEGLAARRDEVIAIAEDIIAPALQFPGNEGAPRPYNISLGARLADAPLIAAALDWIDFAVRPLPLSRAAVLLRSPYLPDAQGRWPARASIEKTWLERGRRDIHLPDAIDALDRVDRGFADRLRRAHEQHRVAGAASPREWIDRWRSWLAAIGWPGDRTLSSAEQQTREAFDDLMFDFASIAIVDARMRASDATTALHGLAAETVFQPESPPVPVQILGLLEATGLPFDALWLAGLSADRWPRAPQPHPLLPLGWQRDHDVPRSSPARELGFARSATAMLMRAAPDVVVSYPLSANDDEPRKPSPLIAGVPLAAEAHPHVARYARLVYETRPAFDCVADYRAPSPTDAEPLRGGARLVEQQADCPFQAVATCRLLAERWPASTVGLTPLDRGAIVHAAMAAFWSDVRDSATLAALDDEALNMRIARAASIAQSALPDERWRSIAPVVAAGETARIEVLMRAWIDAHERTRAPFTVTATEVRAELVLAGMPLRLRIDRIDRVGDNAIIIDYKTGPTLTGKAWFDRRPRAPQLALYALARHGIASEAVFPTRAVAYAQMQTGALRMNGIVADALGWPGLLRLSGVAPTGSDWEAVEQWWQARLGALIDEVRNGVAHVAPRDATKTCRLCALGALCRVGAAAVVDENGDE